VQPRFVVLGGWPNKPFSKKAQNVCDVTQYAYAEYQVTKHIYTLAMNLVTLKCQCLNGNNSAISASVTKFLPFWNEMDSKHHLSSVLFPFAQVYILTATYLDKDF
jgi:hypothetical protein